MEMRGRDLQETPSASCASEANHSF